MSAKYYTMPTYSVKVEFIVRAEPISVWSAQAAALDYVRHKINEGYELIDQIREWNFLSVDQIPDREEDDEEV